MKFIYHPDIDEVSLAGVLYALGDPVRLTIVSSLAQHRELTCGIAYPLPIPKSTLSHHLKILREAGIIHVRPQGREFYNSLRRDELNQRFPGLLDSVLHSVVAAS